MKKFEGILICTDLDGTLLRNDKSISRENLDAIEYFKAEGGFFTFITGRMPAYVPNIYNTINPNAPFGCINGGGLFDHRTMKYVYTTELPRTALRLVADVERAIPEVGIQVSTFDKVYFPRDNRAMEIFREHTGLPNLVKPYFDIDEPLAKVIIAHTEDSVIRRIADFLTSHPEADGYGFIRSDAILYEILPKGVCKGAILPKLAEYLGIDMKRTVAIGDYDNDVTMLQAAGVGIAVSNATPDAKAAADLITVSNEEHAIARIISDIESGAIKI